MAKLTKQQTRTIERIMHDLNAAHGFLRQDRVAVCVRRGKATTTLDYSRADGASLAEINKEAGSQLVQLDTALRRLHDFVQENSGLPRNTTWSLIHEPRIRGHWPG